MNTLSVVASVVSVIIGAFAIWLSVTFYRMSNKASEDIKTASNKIGSTVSRLEALFDKLYADTFTMMKETVSDMRKHVWRDSASMKTDQVDASHEMINQIKKEFSQKLDTVLKKQRDADSRFDVIEKDVQEILDNAITASQKVTQEIEGKSVNDAVIKAVISLGEIKGKAIPADVIQLLEGKYDHDQVIPAIFDLRHENKITWEGSSVGLKGDDELKLVK